MKEINWKKVWKSFDRWFYDAEIKCILHDWETQIEKIEKLVERQLEKEEKSNV